MGLSSIFRRDPADTAQNGNSALVVNDKMDLALRFFEHVIAALDIIDEARQRKDASAAAEDDTDKKTN
jgi:hypothetical protein